MQIDFHSSERSSLGVEMELEIIDAETRELHNGATEILYAGTNSGVYVSMDEGATWTTTSQLAGLHITSIAVIPGTPTSVISALARRYRLRLHWLFYAATVAIVASTILLGYHYIVDVLAALPIAWLAWRVSRSPCREARLPPRGSMSSPHDPRLTAGGRGAGSTVRPASTRSSTGAT